MSAWPPADENPETGELTINPDPVRDPLGPRQTPAVIPPATTIVYYKGGKIVPQTSNWDISYTISWPLLPAWTVSQDALCKCDPAKFTLSRCSDELYRYLYDGEGLSFTGVFFLLRRGAVWWGDIRTQGADFQAHLFNGGPEIVISGNPEDGKPKFDAKFSTATIPISGVLVGTINGIPPIVSNPQPFNGTLTLKLRSVLKVVRNKTSATGTTFLSLHDVTYAGPMAEVINDSLENWKTGPPPLTPNLPMTLGTSSSVTATFAYDTFQGTAAK